MALPNKPREPRRWQRRVLGSNLLRPSLSTFFRISCRRRKPTRSGCSHHWGRGAIGWSFETLFGES